MINRPYPPVAVPDLLSDALGEIDLVGAIHCCATLGSPWAVAVTPHTTAMLYAPAEGCCRIETAAGTRVDLSPGDIAFLVRPGPHIVRSEAATAAIPLETLLQGACEGPGQLVRHGGNGPVTKLVVGWIDFAAPAHKPLLGRLPEVLTLRGDDPAVADWQGATLAALVRDSTLGLPGGQAVSRRLTEALFIAALRRHIGDAAACDTGWLAALRDARLTRVLAALHREPARRWTLPELAAIACLSRTAVFDLFKRRVGVTPHAYLTDLRIRAAERALRSGACGVEATAFAVGYGSAAAFSRAYRRSTGRSPRTARTHRSPAPAPSQPPPPFG